MNTDGAKPTRKEKDLVTCLSKEQFKYFKQRCNHWVKMFGLTDWRIYYEFVEVEGAFANCGRNSSERIATIKLNPEWKSSREPTREAIDRTALHEVCHILLSRFHWMGECRFLMDNELDDESEAVIHRLEVAILGSE